MPQPKKPTDVKKKLHVQSPTGHDEREGDTVEGMLKDLAKEAKSGELAMPVSLSFNGPGGSAFTITITSADAVHEISAMGFMF